MVIELRGVSFSYGQHDAPVFEALSFALKQGECVALLGPNGAGKSTMLKLMMGLLVPTSGQVHVLGKHRARQEDFVEVRRAVGYLFQDSEDQLFCPTVEEDIAFGPLNLGLSHAQAIEVARETCAALGIEALMEKVTHRLSGGEKRLVALATVAAMKPQCYLLDEPTAGLDEQKTARVVEYLKANAQTCIVSSHDAQFLRQLTTRSFHMRSA